MCKTAGFEGVLIGDLYYRLANDKDRDEIVEAFFTYMLQGKCLHRQTDGVINRHIDSQTSYRWMHGQTDR
jgi:hypothetical protein